MRCEQYARLKRKQPVTAQAAELLLLEHPQQLLLSLQTQVKLLRVLQQKEFSRLGSNRLLPLKARVLFATHRNLAQMVDEGTFRRDLYYRVNVMRINVPPLRERTDDIPLLADHFLRIYAS